jgi:hypothetical protein
MAHSRLASQHADQATAPIAAWRRHQIPHTRTRRPADRARATRSRLAGDPVSAEVSGPASSPLPAQRVGDRYRLDDLVRVVNGARVWRGTDEVLNRAVMVWALPADQPAAAEVQAAVLGAARLSDPRIARIFDADCAIEHPYVISEWPGGEYLDDLLQTDCLSRGSPPR